MGKVNKVVPYFFSNQSYKPASLLERSASADYLEEWAEILKNQLVTHTDSGKVSVVIFRIGYEWLALKTTVFKEIIHRRVIHQIPHRSGKILKGVVNLDGELQLCIALNELLGIEINQVSILTKFSYQQNRMIAIQKDQDLWVFAVEEIAGIHIWHKKDIENVPVNVIKSSHGYLSGVLNDQQKSIGLIDEELLFYSLRRSLL